MDDYDQYNCTLDLLSDVALHPSDSVVWKIDHLPVDSSCATFTADSADSVYGMRITNGVNCHDNPGVHSVSLHARLADTTIDVEWKMVFSVTEYFDAFVKLATHNTTRTFTVTKVAPIDSLVYHRNRKAKYFPGFLGLNIPDSQVTPQNFGGPFYLNGRDTTVDVFLLKTKYGKSDSSYEFPGSPIGGIAPFDIHLAFKLIDQYLDSVRLGTFPAKKTGLITMVYAQARAPFWYIQRTTDLWNCFDLCIPSPTSVIRTYRALSDGINNFVCYKDSTVVGQIAPPVEQCFGPMASIKPHLRSSNLTRDGSNAYNALGKEVSSLKAADAIPIFR